VTVFALYGGVHEDFIGGWVGGRWERGRPQVGPRCRGCPGGIGDDIVLVIRQLTMFVKEQDLRNAQAECGLHVEGSKESRSGSPTAVCLVMFVPLFLLDRGPRSVAFVIVGLSAPISLAYHCYL
jgi:hypothetical protein